MQTVLMLLALVGLAHAVQNAEGPFGMFSKIRNLLARVPVVGPMFFKLFSCDFCSGFWSGLGTYMFVNMGSWQLTEMLIWAFGGGCANHHFNRITSKLEGPTAEETVK